MISEAYDYDTEEAQPAPLSAIERLRAECERAQAVVNIEGTSAGPLALTMVVEAVQKHAPYLEEGVEPWGTAFGRAQALEGMDFAEINALIGRFIDQLKPVQELQSTYRRHMDALLRLQPTADPDGTVLKAWLERVGGEHVPF